VFVEGKRPGDELITASLEEAGAPVEETHHATKPPAKPAKTAIKPRTAKKTKTNSKAKKTRIHKS
jgi:hypothetical protein